MTLVVCIVARSRQSGKTSVLEAITRRLSGDGLRIATVKHIHGSFDTPEKDTWRHLEAGALMTVAASPNSIVALRRQEEPSLDVALQAVYLAPDLVLVEGYKHSSKPKIVVIDDASAALAAADEITHIIGFTGAILGKPHEQATVRGAVPAIPIYTLEDLCTALKTQLSTELLTRLPGLNCGACGHASCRDLVQAVLEGAATLSDCTALTTGVASLRVDGQLIPLTKFPQDVLRGVVMGLLGALKGVEPDATEIEVTIRRREAR
jgi:molybdopterin-guanine dinucleotide biosynthesis protein B